MKKLAPICLFTYDRLDLTIQTVTALQNNYLAKKSKLFIFSDGPKNKNGLKKVLEVRNFINGITGFKKIQVFESKKNIGLANSIINGVTKIIQSHGKVIVLEDDLITSKNFLDFMNKALDFYENHKNIQSINGYSLYVGSSSLNFDIYCHTRTYSWGWATWSNRWQKPIFDKKSISNILDNEMIMRFNEKCGANISRMLKKSLNDENDSWYASWAFNHFINDSISIYPYLSKVKNIGYGNDATHCTTINVLKSKFDQNNFRDFKFDKTIKVNDDVSKKFLKYFTFKYKLFFRIKLIFQKEGIDLLINEFKIKFLQKK